MEHQNILIGLFLAEHSQAALLSRVGNRRSKIPKRWKDESIHFEEDGTTVQFSQSFVAFMNEVSSSKEEKISKKRKSCSSSERELTAGDAESIGSRSTNTSPTLRSRNFKHVDHKLSGDKEREDFQSLQERDALVGDVERARQRVLEKLKDIRRRAVASRDEHRRQLLVIERQVSASTAALLRAKTMREAKKKLPELEQMQRDEVDFLSFGNFQVPTKQFPVSFSTAPALPASYVYGQSDPPQRLAYEENVLKLAREIVKKNTALAMSRLPKQPEPPRAKVLWDYLLDEVVWLATDFRQERKHKICVAKRLAEESSCRISSRVFNETERRARARTVASLVAKFWLHSRNLYICGNMNWNNSIEDVEEQQLNRKLAQLDDFKNESLSWNEENIPLEGEEDTSEMTEAQASLSECILPTEEQRDEEITALFDSVNSMSSSVDPDEYLTNSGPVTKSEGPCTSNMINVDKLAEEKAYDSHNNNIAALEKNCFADFGFFKKSVEAFLSKLSNMSGNENFSISIDCLPDFNGTLKEFQFQTVQWLASCYKRQCNALLADDRNCGKTISTIAFLTWLAKERTNSEPCLMFCSIAELKHLQKELELWFPTSEVVILDKLSNYLNETDSFNGDSGKLRIFLGSYNLLKNIAASLGARKWLCLILKDDQDLRNVGNEALKELESLETQLRIVITQNYENSSFIDLWRYLCLLVPKLLPPELQSMDISYVERISSKYLNSMMNKLEKAIKPFTLRRRKELLSTYFPKRTEDILTCFLSKTQRKIYDEVISMNKLSTSRGIDSVDHLRMMLKTLKRLCIHADLIEPSISTSPFLLPRIELRIPKDTIDICDMQMFSCESSFFLIRKTLYLLHFELYANVNKQKVFESCSLQPSKTNFLSGEEEWQDAFRFLVRYNSSFRNDCCTDSHSMWNVCSENSSLTILDMSTEPLVEPFSSSDWRNYSISGLSSLLGLTGRSISQTGSSYPELLSVIDTQRSYSFLEIFDFDVTRAVAKVPVMNYRYGYNRNELECLEMYLQNSCKPNTISRNWLSYYLELNSGKLKCLHWFLESLMKQKRRCIIVVSNIEVLDVLEYFMQLYKFTFVRIDSTMPVKRRYMLASNLSQNTNLLCCMMNIDAYVSCLKVSGVDTLIYFEHSLDMKDSQVEQIVYNLSQDRPVHIVHMVSSETIEEKLLMRTNHLFKVSSTRVVRESVRERLISELFSGDDDFESRLTLSSYSTEHIKSSESSLYKLSSVEKDTLEDYFSSLLENEINDKMDFIYPTDEVDDVVEDSDLLPEHENKQSLSQVQCFCFKILDRMRSDSYTPVKLGNLPNVSHSSKHGVTDPFREDLRCELFYTRMMDDESRLNYSRTVDNSSCDLKIYLPLHESGKEELAMSTVVDKTAANGIESAEDAAFFPYAYSRLSRTSDATRLQKAKLLEDKFLEQNGQSSSVSKGTASWEGNNKVGTISPLANKHLQSHERKSRTVRRNFLDGSEEKFLFWTPDEDRELVRAVKSCYQNYMICRHWLRWTTFSLCRLKRPRTDNECKARFESFSNDGKELFDPSNNSSTDSDLLKRHVSLLLSTVHEKYKQTNGTSGSNNELGSEMEPHPSYAKLAKSVLGERMETVFMPNVIPSPKITNEEWKPGYKTNDNRLQQPFIRRSSLFSRFNFQGSGSVLSSQGTFRHFRHQRSEVFGNNLRRPLNNMGAWPYDQRSQLLNAKSLTRTKAGTTMSSSNFSMRPNVLTKWMRKPSEQARSGSIDVKLSFESGANYQGDTNLAIWRYTQGGGRMKTSSDVPSAESSPSRNKRQTNDLQTSTNSSKRIRKSLRLDESG